MYVERSDGSTWFRWVKAPTTEELTQLAHTIAHRVGRFLERQGVLERDAENSYLTGDAVDDAPMAQLLGSSITYRIAVGPQAGRKVFTLQTLPAFDPEDQVGDTVGKVAGFSLHAGVAARADERKKLERLWHHACDLRAAGLHGKIGGPGAETAREFDALSRGVCAEQQTSRSGHPGKAGQGQQGQGSR